MKLKEFAQIDTNKPITIDEVIEFLIQHEKDHPDHGVGCICVDSVAVQFRRAMIRKSLNYKDNPKPLSNFIRALTYITRSL